MNNDELLEKLYGNRAEEIKEVYEPLPIPSKPIITLQDVNKKFVERYFVQLANEKGYITEVNKTEFTALKKNPRFVTVMIKWKIVGKKETITRPGNIVILGTADLNKNAVIKADLTMDGLRNYIKDYTEYWYAEFYE